MVTTIDQLLADENWAEVFADENSGNVSKETNGIGGCAATPPSRGDVSEIIAIYDSSEIEWDGWNGFGVFRLKEGRFLFASGSCDYTGWD